MRDFHNIPNLVVSDAQGNTFDIPELKMAGASGLSIRPPEENEIMPMPDGSMLCRLPDRAAIGLNPDNGKQVLLETYKGVTVFPVAVFMAPAHTQTLFAAYKSIEKAGPLPLYAYAAAGWRDNAFYVAGIRTDPGNQHNPCIFIESEVNTAAKKLTRRFPGNRVVRHLVENCIRRYGCPNAKNLALGRYEAPAPISPVCNATCAGCLSKKTGKAPCPQERISFTPDPLEITEYAIPHLEKALHPLISFGQGCEGEPLMRANLAEAVIRGIRQKTAKGTLHMNTNGSKPDALEALFEAGLDSVRISLNSAREEYYCRHFKPGGYSFDDVKKSLCLTTELGKWCSINYFVFPGFTDNTEETTSFIRLLKETRPQLIQLRNLNMDPDEYRRVLGKEAFRGKNHGILPWMKRVKEACPWVRFGYYNPAKEDWRKKIIPD